LIETLTQASFIAPHIQLGDTTASSTVERISSDGVGNAVFKPKKHASIHEDETITDEAMSGCMQNIQREEVAKHDSEIALLSVASNIVAVSDSIAALDNELKALDRSIATSAEWGSEDPALRHKEHDEFTTATKDLLGAQSLLTKALKVLQDFYGPVTPTDGSKASLLRGKPLSVQGSVTEILGIPTRYTKQDCSLARHYMMKFSAFLVTRTDEVEQKEHDAITKYQHSESNAKMVRVAAEKSLAEKKHSKSALETQLLEHQRQRVQLAEDQRNINLRLLQLHHDCDVISHSIDSSIQTALTIKESTHETTGTSWDPQKTAWINAHHGLHLMRWKMVLAFSLLSIALVLLLFPIVSMLGTLFHCSVIAFILPRHQKSLPNPKIYNDVSADDHLG